MVQLLPSHAEKVTSSSSPTFASLPSSISRRLALLVVGASLAGLYCLFKLFDLPPSLLPLCPHAVFSLSKTSYPKDPLGRAQAILQDHPLIDGHIDVPVYSKYFYGNKVDQIPFDAPALPNGSYPMPGQVDIPRLRLGHSGGYFWSAYVECPPPEHVGPDFRDADKTLAVRDTLEQLDVIKQLVDKYKDFQFASTAASARRAFKEGKFISFIGLEGGHSLGNSLLTLRTLASLFAKPGQVGPLRYLTLTHTCHNAFGDSSSQEPPKWNGLSPFGVKLVHELNRLGIVPDLSHTADETASQTIDVSKGPVMLSHSSARALNDVPRNAPDWLLEKLAAAWKERRQDSVVMINAFPGFIGGGRDIQDVADHVEHVAAIVGKDHVGLGTDFDGILEVPEGLEDVTKYPDLVAILIQRGWSDKEVIDFAGENVLRVLEQAEIVAARLKHDGAQPDNTSWQDVFVDGKDA